MFSARNTKNPISTNASSSGMRQRRSRGVNFTQVRRNTNASVTASGQRKSPMKW